MRFQLTKTISWVLMALSSIHFQFLRFLFQDYFIKCFEDISEWVCDSTGIEIPKELIRFDVYRNNRGGMSAQGRIGYRGPMDPISKYLSTRAFRRTALIN